VTAGATTTIQAEAAGAPDPAPVGVYYINLARRQDRRAAMEAMLTRIGVPFERIEAVEGEKLDGAARRAGPHGYVGPRHRACTMSHFEAMQRLLASPHQAAVILEDDVRIAPDLARLCASLDWLPPGAGLVKLETCPVRGALALIGRGRGCTPAGRRLHPLLSRYTGSGGYLIDRASAEAVLSAQDRIHFVIDHLLFNPNVSEIARCLKPMQMVPAVVEQQPAVFGTDLAQERKSDAPTGLDYLRRELRRGLGELRLLPAQFAAVVFHGARLVRVEWAEEPGSAARSAKPRHGIGT